VAVAPEEVSGVSCSILKRLLNNQLLFRYSPMNKNGTTSVKVIRSIAILGLLVIGGACAPSVNRDSASVRRYFSEDKENVIVSLPPSDGVNLSTDEEAAALEGFFEVFKQMPHANGILEFDAVLFCGVSTKTREKIVSKMGRSFPKLLLTQKDLIDFTEKYPDRHVIIIALYQVSAINNKMCSVMIGMKFYEGGSAMYLIKLKKTDIGWQSVYCGLGIE
jgi:hypothetical protein